MGLGPLPNGDRCCCRARGIPNTPFVARYILIQVADSERGILAILSSGRRLDSGDDTTTHPRGR